MLYLLVLTGILLGLCYLSLLCRWGNWGFKRISNLLSIMDRLSCLHQAREQDFYTCFLPCCVWGVLPSYEFGKEDTGLCCFVGLFIGVTVFRSITGNCELVKGFMLNVSWTFFIGKRPRPSQLSLICFSKPGCQVNFSKVNTSKVNYSEVSSVSRSFSP